nr:transcriptional protein SWT1 [Nothobranchius furzeri]
MPKEHRKRKEKDDKDLRKEDDRRKSLKRKGEIRERPERSTSQQKKSRKDDFPKTHSTTKPDHGRTKTHTEEQKHTKTKRHRSRSDSGQRCGKGYGKEEKQNASGHSKKTSGTTQQEMKHLKSSNSSNAASASRETKIAKERTGKISSRGGSLGLSVLDVLKQSVKKKAENPSRTRCDNSNSRTRGPASAIFKDFPQQKSREKVENSHVRHQAKELLAKRSPSKNSHDLSACVSDKSSSSAKHPTSGSNSELWKTVTSTCKRESPASQMTTSLPHTGKEKLSQKFLPFKFRIPKKSQTKPGEKSERNNNVTSTNQKVENTHFSKKLLDSGLLERKPELKSAQSCTVLHGGQDKVLSPNVQLPPAEDSSDKHGSEQAKVVEEIQNARSENRLEVNVTQSYGELTSMDIDSAEEGPVNTPYQQPCQQELILILDTNILIKHLDYVKKINSHGLGALGFPVVLIPWVVLQELDYLKKGRDKLNNVAHLVNPAISFIYNALKRRDPRLWGQSMQQAAMSSDGLKSENNDDRVLQCCLQYQKLYPECAVILCTNDKNLCSKAVLSGVKALCKNDLEVEVRTSGHLILQSSRPQVLPRTAEVTLDTNHAEVQPCGQMEAVDAINEDTQKQREGNDKRMKLELSRCLFELEECLREVLSDVLEVEMKAAFGDIWKDIILIKPPWTTLQGVLQCFDKHWIAVFGFVVPRKMNETLSHLIHFFRSGQSVNSCSTSAILQEAKTFIGAFWKSSRLVPQAVTTLENLYNTLQPRRDVFLEEESVTGDVTMKDDDDVEGKPTVPARVAPQEVWSMFENIWSHMFQTSLDVFKGLGFDPHTMQTATPVGGPAPPPQDTIACLQKLSSVVSQLLQAFSSFFCSSPDPNEVRNLLNIIYSIKIDNENCRLTAEDLYDCFTQPHYREKLRVGGSQLMELKKALDCCAQTLGQHTAFNGAETPNRC